MDINTTIWDLMARKLAGELSTEEEATLHTWIKENPGSEKVLDQLGNIWKQVAQPGDIVMPKQELVWKALNDQLDLEDESVTIKPLVVEHDTRKRYLPVAAGLLAAVVLILVISSVFHPGVEKNDPIARELIVAPAELSIFPEKPAAIKLTSDSSQVYVLPDKSRVWLNKNSRISYLPDFGDSIRKIQLKGEAFFEIQRDEARPFIISANGSETRVLGTTFNLRAYEKEDPVLTVVSGKVAFANEDTGNDVLLLTKGEKATLHKKENMLSKKKNDQQHFLDWKHILVYKKEISYPANYMKSTTEWKKSKIKQTEIRGQIKNLATLATYKNVKLRVSYYKKRKKKNHVFTVYKSLGPGETIHYKYRLADWFARTDNLKIEIVDASVSKN
ncbi:FecR family protein [Fulvivirgaceae bacterium BMA12]|uniref:FecR family protein n=1 Tax=Agaribacillus aureus TaxID=3051825 RepID=A0ABT8L1D5_9BACT|nr:FecR family protein [Fulvivirgaceae bacterium BMA12]